MNNKVKILILIIVLLIIVLGGINMSNLERIKELRERNEMKFVDTNLEKDFEDLVQQYESQYSN